MTASLKHRAVIVRPLITEKATAMRVRGVYAFEVDRDASKPQIKQAVEDAFKVKVATVRTMNRLGKRRRLRLATYGKRPDWKKALVTLQAGEKITFFEGL